MGTPGTVIFTPGKVMEMLSDQLKTGKARFEWYVDVVGELWVRATSGHGAHMGVEVSTLCS